MAKISRMTKKRLGELLIEAGYIKDEQLQEVLGEQRKTGELLGEVLVRLGMVTEENIAQTLVAQFGIPFMRASQYFIGKEMAKLFPEAMLKQYMFVPVDRIGNVLVIISAGLLNQDIVNELERATGCKVQAYIGIQSDVRKAIEKHFHAEADETPALSSLGSLLLDENSEPSPAAAEADKGGGDDLSIDDSPIFGTANSSSKTAQAGKPAVSATSVKTPTGAFTAPGGGAGKPFAGTQSVPGAGSGKPLTSTQSVPRAGTGKPLTGTQSVPGAGMGKPLTGTQSIRPPAGSQTMPGTGRSLTGTQSIKPPAGSQTMPGKGTTTMPGGTGAKTPPGKPGAPGTSSTSFFKK